MENINDKVGAAHTTYVGVGHGLQIQYGPHRGRLVYCYMVSLRIDFHWSSWCL